MWRGSALAGTADRINASRSFSGTLARSQVGRRNSYLAKAQPQPDHGLMTRLPLNLLRISVTVAALWAGLAAASGQISDQAGAEQAAEQSPGFLDGLFGRGDQGAAPSHSDRMAQSSATDLSVRIDRLDSHIRHMPGVI